MVPQTITYIGELRCKAKHGPSGVKLVTDAPTDNHGKGKSFSPTDLMVTALATCIITTTGIVAERDGIPLAGTKIYAEKHMSTDGLRRIAKIVLRFEVSPGVEVEVRKKLEATARACPVLRSLHPEIVVDISFSYPD